MSSSSTILWIFVMVSMGSLVYETVIDDGVCAKS